MLTNRRPKRVGRVQEYTTVLKGVCIYILVKGKDQIVLKFHA